jgi:uncharacterized membrane protein YdbT with pleckstrin-like domain
MSYTEKVLLPDERIVYAAGIHWVVYLRGLAITIFGGVASYYSYDFLLYAFGATITRYAQHAAAGLGLIIVLVGVAFLAGAYVRQTSTELVLTNKRIIAKYGFVSRTTFEIMISRITGANFDQTVLGRLLDFGTILVHGAGGEISPIDEVEEPQKFHQALMAIMEKVRLEGR